MLNRSAIHAMWFADGRCAVAATALTCAVVLGGCSLAPGFGVSKQQYAARAPVAPVTTVPVTAMPLGPLSRGGAPAASHAVLALPSAAGSIKRVKERHYVNGSRQEIELVGPPGTPGQNVIDVSIRTNSSSGYGKNFLAIGEPSDSGIRNEILGRFPDVRMNIVTTPMRNRFGVFGLAIGRHANGARCVFAWQWVNDLRDQTPGVSNVTKFGAMLGGRQLATSIRIRLCQKGVTVDQLAGYIQGLSVMGRGPLNRLVNMDRRNISTVQTSGISQSGINSSSPLRPVGGSLESALDNNSRSKITTPVKSRRNVRRSRSARRSGPRRSSADSYNRIRHYSGTGRPVATAPVATAPAASAAAPGTRYLAPVATNAPPPVASRSPAGAYKPSGAVSLPPEAYRGPQK